MACSSPVEPSSTNVCRSSAISARWSRRWKISLTRWANSITLPVNTHRWRTAISASRANFTGSVIEFAHLVSEIFHLLLQRAEIAEDRHTFVEDGSTGELQAILRQVAVSRVLCGGDVAVVERLHAAKNLQQRRLTRAIGADQADAFVRRDQPIQVVEE